MAVRDGSMLNAIHEAQAAELRRDPRVFICGEDLRTDLWGTVSGSMLPIILKKLGADPATSSAPFVATLVDVTGLIIYFSMAYVFLSGILL